MKRAISVLVLLIASVLLSSCTGEPAAPQAASSAAPSPAASLPALPDASEVAALVDGSGEFGDYQFVMASVSVPMKGSLASDATKPIVEELNAAGWVSVDKSWNVSLTGKSRGDKRFLVRQNGFLEIVPLAKKELIEVTSIKPAAGGDVTADVTWRWLPNEVGAAFKTGELHDRFTATNHAVATLYQAKGEWKLYGVKAPE